MTEKLSFTCEIEESCESLEKRISQAIKENESKFWPYFSRLIDIEKARYTVLDNSLEIEQVCISGSQGSAYGNFTWDFYASCKDLNSTDEQEVDISFKISGNTLIFDIELPIIWRSDED